MWRGKINKPIWAPRWKKRGGDKGKREERGREEEEEKGRKNQATEAESWQYRQNSQPNHNSSKVQHELNDQSNLLHLQNFNFRKVYYSQITLSFSSQPTIFNWNDMNASNKLNPDLMMQNKKIKIQQITKANFIIHSSKSSS